MALLRLICVFLLLSTSLWGQSAADNVLKAAKAAVRSQDYIGALSILQAADLQQSPEVLLLQASLYQTGRGVPRDEAKSYNLTRAAADLGSTDAQYNLGRLLLAGRGVEADRQAGQAWITNAAEAGHIRAAALLINLLQSPAVQAQSAADPESVLPSTQGSDISRRLGWTPLMEAAQRGQHKLLEALIPEVNVNAHDSQGRTALMLAISANDEVAVDMLLRAGADPEAVDNAGNTALGYAAEGGDDLMARMLIAASAWPDLPNTRGQTPLDIAVISGHNDVAVLMLEKSGLTLPEPLLRQLWFLSAKEGSYALFEALAARGGQCELRDANQLNAIDNAAESGNLDLLRYCLNTGTMIEPETLIRAVQARQIEFAMALLVAGINPNSESQSGNSPLVIAANIGSELLVEALLNRGAEVDHRNNAGNSALMLGAQNGNAVVVTLLLSAGADPDLRNRLREQAQDIAFAAGYPEIAQMID